MYEKLVKMVDLRRAKELKKCVNKKETFINGLIRIISASDKDFEQLKNHIASPLKMLTQITAHKQSLIASDSV